MNKIGYTMLLMLGLIAGSLHAQQENTLHAMRSIPQSGYSNPAFAPNYKFFIGLPGISSDYISIANTGFAYSDLFQRTSDDSLILTLPKMQGKLKKKNYISNQAQVDLLSFGFKVNARMYFTYNFSAKTYTRFMYPKGLTQLLVEGNAGAIGSTISMSPSFQGQAYLEHGFGVSYIHDNKLSLGLRFKYLKGGLNINTESASFDLATSEDYYLTLSGDANIKTSGVQGFEDLEADLNYSSISEFTSNNGFAFDLGAAYRVNDKMNVSLSLLDLGSIKWKRDLYGYSLDKNTASYTYKGVDLANDNESGLFDSLEANFELEEGLIEAYRTALPCRMYLSGNYELSRNLYTGLTLFAEKYHGRFMSGVSANINKDFGRRLNLALSYSAINNAYNNVGFGFVVKVAALQFYGVSDNIVNVALSPTNFNQINARVGINLLFGKIYAQEKLHHPQ